MALHLIRNLCKRTDLLPKTQQNNINYNANDTIIKQKNKKKK